MTTPPGWYPEPGHTGTDAPALERWWDGTEWTEYTRTAQGQAAATAAPGYPPYPGDVVAGGAPSGRRGGRIAIAVVASVVVVAAVVGGVVALTSDNGNSGKNAAGSQPSPSASAPFGQAPDGSSGGSDGGLGGVPSTQPSTQPSSEPGFAADALDGISIPVPDGWKSSYDSYGLPSLSVSSYKCPGDTSKTCVRGGVNSYPAAAMQIKATTAEAAAKEDISANATASYGDNVYGGISSHKELTSEAVTVAGQKGYLVRWQVVTKKGDDGYVESLVFPSPSGSKQLVLVRFGFDINSKAPKLSVMDTITKGIKATGSSNGTGV
ncbi:DUF2510 domain-containing protein [Streptomyces sp. NPDC059373]